MATNRLNDSISIVNIVNYLTKIIIKFDLTQYHKNEMRTQNQRICVLKSEICDSKEKYYVRVGEINMRASWKEF